MSTLKEPAQKPAQKPGVEGPAEEGLTVKESALEESILKIYQ